MKARRLILEEDSSTESRGAAWRGCLPREAGPEATAFREKEAPAGKKPKTTEVKSTPVEPSWATRKDKGKAVLTEEVPSRQDEVPSAGITMKTYRERTAEVLAVSSDIEEDPLALEEVVAKAVEDVGVAEGEPQKVASPRTSTGTVIRETDEDPSAEEAQSQAHNAADMLCVQVLPLLQYLDRKREKYAEATTTVSYMKIVKTHQWLWLRELENRAAELIAGSGQRQRRLAKKLDAFLSRSRDTEVNLELELAAVLKRLGLDRTLEGAATANFAGVGPIRSSH
ncbi:hypothetical protein AXG93_1838s1220 [Marchantia polymorpha subsp. ruderalis]|uniref:Uncharacterized protein n=1 Tax=Marchantia polymorpha subsp. ruderalis TaxID=1480154 RepID=A0A176WHK4_MARPO|nr:hypothetical protein AXG93_1838s1220 [Marchantia polymorpha subsp. ruderalis]